jgi:hypothetical protein
MAESLETFREEMLPGRTSVEVTDVLGRACESMKPGQLIHTETFTLLEALSAIEIGDQKVDIGVIADQSNTGVPSELFEAGKAPLELDSTRLLSLLDGMLAREISWYRGNFLAETLYTCLYLHDMERLKGNSILKAYCELTRLTCLEVTSVIHRAGVSEEEDFCIAYQGLPLHKLSGGSDDYKRWLSFASGISDKLGRICAAGGSDPVSLNSEEFPIGKVSKEDIRSIRARIRFRCNYLNIIKSLEDGEVGANRAKLEKYAKEAQGDLDIIAKSFRETTSEGAAAGFVQYLNKAHMPAIPPRTIENVSGDEIVKYFKDFLEHAMIVCKTSKCKNISSLESHLGQFSDRCPEAIVRSLQALCCARLNTKEMVSTSIGLSVKYLESEPELEFSFDKCKDIVAAYANAACHHKSQQHRKFKKLLRTLSEAVEELKMLLSTFKDFESKSNAAAEDNKGKDDDRAAASMGRNGLGMSIVITWLNALSHSVALQQLLVGFDLDLYEKTEFLMIYWYCERLLTGYIEKVQEWNSLCGHLSNALSTGKGSSRKQRKEKGAVVLVNEDQMMSRIFVLEAWRLCCNGINRMLAGLKKHKGVGIAKELPWGGEEKRYNQRFSHMQYADYEQYVYATDTSAVSEEKLFDSARISFGNCIRLQQHYAKTFKKGSTPHEVSLFDVLPLICKKNTIALKLMEANTELKCGFEWTSRLIILKVFSN